MLTNLEKSNIECIKSKVKLFMRERERKGECGLIIRPINGDCIGLINEKCRLEGLTQLYSDLKYRRQLCDALCPMTLLNSS